MELKDKLVQLRKKRGISQLELSEKLNISRQAISKWEIGTTVPSADNIKKLSQLYNIPLTYLMNDSEETLPEETANVEVPRTNNKYWRIPKPIAIMAVCLILILCALCASTIILHYDSQAKNSNVIPVEDLDIDVFDRENAERFEIS